MQNKFFIKKWHKKWPALFVELVRTFESHNWYLFLEVYLNIMVISDETC